MIIEELTQPILTILQIGGFIYSAIKIYKLIKKGKQEKHRLLKAILVTQFYEPFLVYDVIKHFRKKGIVKQ
jgi:hypothetical protein